MQNSYLLIILVILTTSCKSSLRRSYEINDPKIENYISINNFLNTKNVDTSNVYVFKNIISYATASNKKLLNIPDAVFFNKDGYQVSYKKSAKDCNAKIDGFLSDLNNFSNLTFDTNKKMEDVVKLISNNKKTKPVATDINVFITWAIFAGKLNDEKSFNWVKLLEQAKANGIKINGIMVKNSW